MEPQREVDVIKSGNQAVSCVSAEDGEDGDAYFDFVVSLRGLHDMITDSLGEAVTASGVICSHGFSNYRILRPIGG
jgi:hypothetical protein